MTVRELISQLEKQDKDAQVTLVLDPKVVLSKAEGPHPNYYVHKVGTVVVVNNVRDTPFVPPFEPLKK